MLRYRFRPRRGLETLKEKLVYSRDNNVGHLHDSASLGVRAHRSREIGLRLLHLSIAPNSLGRRHRSLVLRRQCPGADRRQARQGWLHEKFRSSLSPSFVDTERNMCGNAVAMEPHHRVKMNGVVFPGGLCLCLWVALRYPGSRRCPTGRHVAKSSGHPVIPRGSLGPCAYGTPSNFDKRVLSVERIWPFFQWQPHTRCRRRSQKDHSQQQ